MKYVRVHYKTKPCTLAQVHLKCCRKGSDAQVYPMADIALDSVDFVQKFQGSLVEELQQLHLPRSKGRCPLAYYIGSLPIPDPPLHDEQVHDAVLVAPVLMMTKSDCRYWTRDYFLAINGCVEYNAQYKEDADAGSRGDTNATILCHILCIVESKDINT